MGFFDKLIGTGSEEKMEEKPKAKKTEKKSDKKKIKPQAKTVQPQPQPEPELETKIEIKEERPKSEGQLAIDVYETEDDFFVQSTIAGVKAEDLDISVEDDMVTIRGERQRQKEEKGDKYYYQECYWGAFSRQIILPEEVDGSKAQASMKDGVLTLKIPKLKKTKTRKISVKQEE